MNYLNKALHNLKYRLIAVLIIPFLWIGISCAKDDLMRQIMEPAFNKWTTIDVWKSVNRVWENVFENWKKYTVGLWWIETQDRPSMIVKITRILLSLVVALSVTMILYNWMVYIIQTWSWKEWKNLVKNVVYIVIWIIVSLFSVTIITLLQSVSTTLDEEAKMDWNRDDDGNIVDGEKKWISWMNLFNKK